MYGFLIISSAVSDSVWNCSCMALYKCPSTYTCVYIEYGTTVLYADITLLSAATSVNFNQRDRETQTQIQRETDRQR